MKETNGISKSQTYGGMKKGSCLKCGRDVSKLSYQKQTEHEEKCKAQEKLF